MELTQSEAARAHEILRKLSPREFQVAQHIAQGISPSEIAQELDLSVKTVGTYRERILQKLHLKSNVAIGILCYQAGLVELNP